MAALTAITPVVTGVASTGAAVSASDTIDQGTLGGNGVLLEIINGNASSDIVTISDYGTTPAGNPMTSNQISTSFTNGTSQVFAIRPSLPEPSAHTRRRERGLVRPRSGSPTGSREVRAEAGGRRRPGRGAERSGMGRRARPLLRHPDRQWHIRRDRGPRRVPAGAALPGGSRG